MKLSPEEKAERARERMIESAKAYSVGTYCRKFVAPLFQRMIRGEAGADPRQFVTAVVDGKSQQVSRRVGQCACITCGKVDDWNSGIKGMHTGHFLASRRNSILLQEEGCAPQCASCNFYRSGAPQEFRMWMQAVRPASIDRLENLKRQSISWTREELVDKRIEYSRRLKAAIERMKQ